MASIPVNWLLGNVPRRASPFRASCRRRVSRALLDVLAEITVRKGVTPAQLELAGLQAQEPWIVPIPGTTKLKRLDENAGADQVVLSPKDLEEIDAFVVSVPVQGALFGGPAKAVGK